MTTNKERGISSRGRSFVGVVLTARMQKTVTVEWERRRIVPKFERYEKRRTKVKAHVPDGMEIKKGDIVRIHECRPISKTKHFIVTEIVGSDRLFAEHEMRREESKTRSIKKEKEAEAETA